MFTLYMSILIYILVCYKKNSFLLLSVLYYLIIEFDGCLTKKVSDEPISICFKTKLHNFINFIFGIYKYYLNLFNVNIRYLDKIQYSYQKHAL